MSLLLAAGPATAQGPSYDCAKASTKVERAICDVADLAALDREIAGRVVGRLRGADPSRSEALRQEQRAWLRSRNECERHGAGSGELLVCLRIAMTARAAALRPPPPAPAAAAPATPTAPPRETGPPVAAGAWATADTADRCIVARASADGRRFAIERPRAAATGDPGAPSFVPASRDAGLVEPGDRVVMIVDQDRLPAIVAGAPPRIVVPDDRAPTAIKALLRGKEVLVVRQIDTLLRVPLDGFADAYRDFANRCGIDPAAWR